MKKILAVALGMLVLAGCDNSPEAKEKGIKRDAIKLCWQEYDKKSLDEGSKRFIAGACEKMESDFKAKYGVNP